jgi:hypothetical protein
MRAELLEEVRVIRNDPAVVTDDFLVWKAWFADRKRTAVVPAPVLGIPILANNCRGRKRLEEFLLACERSRKRLTDHTRGFRIVVEATRPVRHLAGYYGCKFACRIPRRVWELGTNDFVDQLRR